MPPKKGGSKKAPPQEEAPAAAPFDPNAEQQTIVPGADPFDSPRIYIKPRDQVQLTEKQLKEEFTKSLSANNPTAPHNITRFSIKDKAFQKEASVDQMGMHYAQDGFLLHFDSDDSRKQKAREDEERNAQARQAEERKADGAESNDDAAGMRNQFNFLERASQTVNNAMRDRTTVTEPPPSVEYSADCTQWQIWDAYLQDIQRAKELESKAKKKKGAEGDAAEKKPVKVEQVVGDPIFDSAELGQVCKIMERMVNQNTYQDIAQDFKFWEDSSDQYREAEGTMLPLWTFNNENPYAKRKHVTSLRWHPTYADLFAVGYGSYDFMKQGSGLIALFSMKNPTHPEHEIPVSCGVMCLDWHPTMSHYLCVGLYDGTVCIYDVRSKTSSTGPAVPLMASTVKTNKHTDPVWQIHWHVIPDNATPTALQFISISSDGRVTMWTCANSQLEARDLVKIPLASSGDGDGDDASVGALASGCCFDFCPHKGEGHIFLVGTEEGPIHKCSTAYSRTLMTYDGHGMSVYTVRWNLFTPKVFLSCSADWTVKLWDVDSASAIMSFDLNSQVGDVAWSPWSSTSFAAVQVDGARMCFFDLHENKNDAICEQKLVRRKKLTKLAFNPRPDTPIILVGNDHCSVVSVKPSPNLRWTAVTKAEAVRKAKEEAEAAAGGGAPRKGAAVKKVDTGDEEQVDPREQELQKLQKILDNLIKKQ